MNKLNYCAKKFKNTSSEGRNQTYYMYFKNDIKYMGRPQLRIITKI